MHREHFNNHILLFFFFPVNKHACKYDEEQRRAAQYRLFMPKVNSEVTDHSPENKAEDYPVVQCGAVQVLPVAVAKELSQMLRSAAHIADTHCGCRAVSPYFSEAFYLYAAGKGYERVRRKVQ